MSIQEQVIQEVRHLSDKDAQSLLEMIQWFHAEKEPETEKVFGEEVAERRRRYLARMDAALTSSGRSAEEINQYIRESRNH